MDWVNLKADVNVWLNKHYTSGRGGARLRYIVLHHNAGINMSTRDCYNAWQKREASAHYQVEKDGTIGQLVHDSDTAWHAGNLTANRESIGIEHANISGAPAWDISEATIDAGAHLTAALCRAYGLGLPVWGKNVFPHSNFSSTACPFAIRDRYRNKYMSLAANYYNDLSTTKIITVDGSTYEMKCDYLIFENDGALYVHNVWANTYWLIPNVAALNDWLTVHKRIGARIHYWSQYSASKSNIAGNLSAFGALVKG